MKYKHIVWPVLLIFIGLIILMSNMGWFHFNWAGIWQLWPVILIIWGISILPMRDLYKYLFLFATIAFTMVFFNRITEPRWWMHFHNDDSGWRWENDDDESGSTRRSNKDQTLTVPFDTLSKRAELRLDAAAGDFTLQGGAKDLLTFSKTGDVGDYSLTTEDVNGVKKVNLKLEHSGNTSSFHKNSVDISLNEALSWNLNFDIGAASIDMQLENYLVDTVNVDAGASSIEMKLGMKNPLTVVVLNAGASSINLQVPKDAGCQVKSESFIVSRNFEGFTKKTSGVYETDNYSTASKKIVIEVKTAVSSISIDRY
jgi:hypothetical protein